MNTFLTWVALLSFLLIGCASNTEQEILDLDDFLPKSEEIIFPIESADSLVTWDIDDCILQALATSGFQFQQNLTIGSNQRFFPERTNFIESQKMEIWNDETDTIAVVWWEYNDSNQLINAFFNWLDCFSPECLALQFGDELRIQSKNSFEVWAGNEVLLWISARNKFDATELLKSLSFCKTTNHWYYSLIQQGKRNIEWEKYNQEEEELR
ncbi:MAG: hypothetical protein JJT77_05240 [Crocinitomicaceae bacterium]|nr:hypothetical protein [Crocinitomicaceae bacterium]